MAGKRRKRKNNSKFITVISIVAFALFVIITLSSKPGGNSALPTWDDVYDEAGIANDTNTDDIPETGLQVHYINVGQGDSILIRCDGANILIDGGDTDAANTVTGYLKKQKVKELDYVVATHPHSDHIGSLDDVLISIKTDYIIMPDVQESVIPTSKTFERLLDAIEDNNVNPILAKPGFEYKIGGGILQVIAPVNDYDDLNNYSVVTRFVYGSTSFVFCGDAEKTAEQDILNSGVNVKADVLKLGHHGSDFSTSKEWLKAVDPKICVISVGKNNDYGHPGEETLKLLKKRGLEYYRTDLNGNIVVSSDGKKLYVKTDKE